MENESKLLPLENICKKSLKSIHLKQGHFQFCNHQYLKVSPVKLW